MPKCNFEGCTRNANFGMIGENKVRCGTHKEKEHKSLSNKICNFDNCTKYASYGNIGESAIRCKNHKDKEHTNLSSPICKSEGCTKYSSFGFIGKFRTKCSEHKEEGQINLSTPKCNFKGCNKSAAYGIEGGTRISCINHVQKEYINLHSKICSEENCSNISKERSDKCVQHGGGIRCIEPNCKRGAADAQTIKCKAHGGGKRCIEPKCTFSAAPTSNKCKTHGGGYRCPNCINWIDSRAADYNYDGYCATCFKYLFPNDIRCKVGNLHSKELLVRNTINKNFDGFIHDKPLYTGNCDCTHRRRIDHRKLIDNTILAIETDEFAHSDYDQKDEEIRYNDLYMIHSGKWIFIRFNPDSKKFNMEEKLAKLIETINQQVIRIEKEENNELVEIIKLFY
jgi:hypothetical protein